MSEFGGRAMCPADEYDDPAIREEMAWHAFEEALVDAGWLEWSRHWRGIDLARLAPLFRNVPLGGSPVIPPIQVVGHRLELRATTDEHLGEADSLVDLTATLVTA